MSSNHDTPQTLKATGNTEPLTNAFQTFLAFCANSTYRDLGHWLLEWKSHHPEQQHWVQFMIFADSSGYHQDQRRWVPWTFFADRRGYSVHTRPKPSWNNTKVTSPSAPIVQCPRCGLWLASAWEYSLHVPNEELPFFVHDDDTDDTYDDGSVCWKIQWLADWEGWEQHAYMPTFITSRLATGLQVQCKERESYYPVVCAHCKMWVQDPGSATLHKDCPAVCWQARHAFWRRPSLSDSCHRNRHALGLSTLVPDLGALVYWRHAISQIFQHKFTIVYHSHCLHELHPITGLPHVHLVVLAFLASPFGSHVFWTASTVQRKLAALRQIFTVLQYVKHF